LCTINIGGKRVEKETIEYDALKLENQLCFPLYACSKEIVKRYKPFLDRLDLTYTQYITMMVLWEQKEINVKNLGEWLYLDSGTLTPVLKKLETKGYISRERSAQDERNLCVKITKSGETLKEEAKIIPKQMADCISIRKEEAESLKTILNKILQKF
jgi:MarR family transcriptional regulator, organic hydroperoxide resistance regulator